MFSAEDLDSGYWRCQTTASLPSRQVHIVHTLRLSASQSFSPFLSLQVILSDFPFQDALVSRVAEVVVLKLPTSLTIHGGAGKPVPALLDGKAGEELQLTCKADATVLPFYFQWRIAGRIIKSQNIENPALLNLVLSKELNGVTVECEVLHPALESPLTTISTLSVTFPPHIKTSVNPKRGLVEGNNASLLCEALANPPATSIIWKKMGTGEIVPSKNGKLVFREVDRVDGGRYICQASNSEGLSESIEELVVHFPPFP